MYIAIALIARDLSVRVEQNMNTGILLTVQMATAILRGCEDGWIITVTLFSLKIKHLQENLMTYVVVYLISNIKSM